MGDRLQHFTVDAGMQIDVAKIPACLRDLPQWVVWKLGVRATGDKPTKLPYQTNDALAKANDPSTWTTFDKAHERFLRGGYDGPGFEFNETDPFCGVDLDGARDPSTGKVSEWARNIILVFKSYAEVSPSKTGVKIFVRGKWPCTKHKIPLPEEEKVSDKEPGIEVYDRTRYFAVTGWRVAGATEIRECQYELEWLQRMYFPDEQATPAPDFRSDDAVLDRARKYIAKLPASMSGSGGHNAAFHAACVLVLGFGLPEDSALAVMQEFNQRCQPAWSDRELAHKVKQAFKQPGERGYLRNAAPANWQRVSVPQYHEPPPPREPRITTLSAAARTYLDSIRDGQTSLITTGIEDVDYAIGGGVEKGEMVIFAARPSMGKSAASLQAIHVWTALGMPCAIVSEEMSSLMLGKRTLQFTTQLPQEHWPTQIDSLALEIDEYERTHAKCDILEGCGSVELACESIEKSVKNFGAQCAVVDYAQILRGVGKTRYEQTSNTSIMLRQLASSTKIVLLVLCQLNRSIEGRSGEYAPVMSDLRDSGQFEQDADVILFLCWPHRINQNEPANRYQFFVAKNRNRAIMQSSVECHFTPHRQMITNQRRENEFSEAPTRENW